MNIDSFVQFIKENFSPTGIVFSTEKAKKIISKNNLSPAEFLRPFGIIPKLIYNSETSSFVISDFRLDFYDSEFYKKIPQSDYATIINRLLSSEKYCSNNLDINLNNIFGNNNVKFTDKIIDKLNDFSFPWFNDYIKLICELIKFNEFELYQQPLCYIYICAIDDPVNIIKPRLSDKNNIPSLIYEKIFTADMPVLIIIVSDKSGEKQITTEEKNEYINGFKKLYNNYYLLYWELNDITNSIRKDLDESTIKYYSGDIWSKYEHLVEKYYYNYNTEKEITKKGELINIYSRKRFHQTLNDFFLKYAIINIEKKMRNIERKVLEAKKGFKNTLFSFFKPEESHIISLNNTFQIYALSYSEFQEYLYATICFFFKDYKQAKEISFLFMNDIKKKSQEHYNAAYELNKLSYFLNNYYNKKNGLEYNEFYKNDDAFESFSNYIKNDYYYEACRALFSGIKIHEQNLTILQLASILADVAPFIPGLPSKDDSFCVNYFYPLINEQISIYYIIHEPIKKRKFLWYIFQASLRYKKESLDNKYLGKYALNDFLLISDFLIKNDKNSFLTTKYFIFEQMENLFKEENNEEGVIISYIGNIKNYINLSKKKKKLYEKSIQTIYINLINLLIKLIEIDKDSESMITNNNFFKNCLNFPEIDNSSILIIEEQDIIINKAYKSENITNSNWKYFDKYDYIPFHKTFLCLTPSDIQTLLNLDNIIQNKQNFSNFFSKRKFHTNINKKINVSFLISNPLPFDINISKMKLICEFKSGKELNDFDIEKNRDTIDKKSFKNEIDTEIIYEEKELILKENSSEIIQLYIQGKKSGRIIIKGIELIIENCITIKHFFNKKNKFNLYPYIKKRKKSYSLESETQEASSEESKKRNRKGSTSSQNSNKSKGSNNSYNHHYSYKESITCDIKDNNNDIIVSFPYGTELNLYKNQIFLMPIKIINNSNINIKHFCFYFSDDTHDIEQSCILSELLFKEIEISNNKENKNNEKVIYVPLIPKKVGKTFVKILFKFEEERTYIDYEIQRFIIILNIKESFSFNFKEIINKYESNIIKADLDLLCSINNYNDNFSLENLLINQKINFSKTYEQINIENISQNESMKLNYINENENRSIIYNKYRINKFLKKNFEKEILYKNEIINKAEKEKEKGKVKLNSKIKEILRNINLEFLNKYDFIKYDKTQSHIIYNFCKILLKDFLIFNWSAKDKATKKDIDGILIYKPKLIFSFSSYFSYKNFIKNLISMKHNILKNGITTICTINISIDTNYYYQLKNVKGIEIYINKEKHDSDKVKWIGLQKYTLNKINDNNENEKEIYFTCLIGEKGIYDINKISLLVHFYFTRNEKKIFNKILSPIIVKID